MNNACLPSVAMPDERTRAPACRTPGFWSRLWRSLNQSPRDAYLGQATDLADLERRLHAWEQRACNDSLLKARSWH